jgi:hypothetical protein
MTRTGPGLRLIAGCPGRHLLLFSRPWRRTRQPAKPPAPADGGLDRPGSGGGQKRAQEVVPLSRPSWTSAGCAASSGSGTWAWASRTRGKLFSAGQPDHLKTGGPLRAGALHARQACAVDSRLRPVPPLSALDEAPRKPPAARPATRNLFNADHPERLGLKAAYHQQCMDCHQEDEQGARRLRRLPPQERARPQAI